MCFSTFRPWSLMLAGALAGGVGGQVLTDRMAAAIAPLNPQSKGPAYVAPASIAPKVPTKVVLTGATSVSMATLTGTQKGSCIRISCTVACSYRIGIGAQTATADDNQLPATTPERMCLPDGWDTIAFYSATAGSAYVAFQGP